MRRVRHLLALALALAAGCGGTHAPLGAPCTSSAVCGGEPWFCDGEAPGGACSRACRGDGDCGGGACTFENGGDVGVCEPACAATADCRAGFACCPAGTSGASRGYCCLPVDLPRPDGGDADAAPAGG